MAVIVISVGTSLLSNNKEEISDHHDTLDDAFQRGYVSVQEMKGLAFDFDGNGKLIRITPNKVDGIKDFSESFFEKYLDESRIKENIKFRTQGLPDLLPAELSSLYLYYYDPDGKPRNENKQKDEIILLTTDTADAVYCARMLKVMIEKLNMFKSECQVAQDPVVIDHLDVYDPEKWVGDRTYNSFNEFGASDCGLANLYQFFGKLSSEIANGIRRVLIRTGGYKEFSADLKMLAMKFGFESYYLFEKSTSFLTLYHDSWPKRFEDIIWNQKISA